MILRIITFCLLLNPWFAISQRNSLREVQLNQENKIKIGTKLARVKGRQRNPRRNNSVARKGKESDYKSKKNKGKKDKKDKKSKKDKGKKKGKKGKYPTDPFDLQKCETYGIDW